MSARGPATTSRVRRRRVGLSLVETMISLVISAMLLLSVASAFVASADAITLNDQFYRAEQSARVSIYQIMSEVRRCISVTVGSNSLAMTTSAGESREYDFNSTTNQITITRYISPTQTSPLAQNCTSCTFSTDGQTVTMLVNITIGNNAITLSGSATPRRAVTYH